MEALRPTTAQFAAPFGRGGSRIIGPVECHGQGPPEREQVTGDYR